MTSALPLETQKSRRVRGNACTSFLKTDGRGYGNSMESVIDVLMRNSSLPESWNPNDSQANLSQGPLSLTPAGSWSGDGEDSQVGTVRQHAVATAVMLVSFIAEA